MADYKVMDTELISIANAIRTKGGTSAQLEFPTGFVSAIGDISGGSSGDYELLEYIHSDGTQVIDLGVKIPQTTNIVIAFKADQNTDQYSWACGADYQSGYFAGVQFEPSGANKTQMHTGDNRAFSRPFNYGSVEAMACLTVASESKSNFCIFSLGYNNGDTGKATIGLYYLIFGNSIYYPCKRLLDNKYGVVNLMNKSFFTSLVGNEFTAGNSLGIYV